MNLLIVDDEEGMREGMRRVLERRRFSIDVAADGRRALEALTEKGYDIALVDLKMPEIDGFQVTEFINEKSPGTVVVIVSALATVEAAVEVTRRGAFDFLVKPFSPADLLQVVERAQRQRQLIQERQTYLSELNRERNLSRQLINSMRDGVIVLNIARKPVLMNPRAEYLLGARYRDGLALEDLGFDNPILDLIDDIIGRVPGPQVYRQTRSERQGVVLQLLAAPWLRDGEVGGVILLLNDVTAEWKSEQDKQRFVSMVSRELAGPLEAIGSCINAVLSGWLDDRIDEIRRMAQRASVRCDAVLDFIRDLKYLGRREGGRIERTVERLDLREVLRRHLELFSAQADRRRIRLTLEAEGDDWWYNADRGDLDRLFMNLVSNGIRYNREGGELEVRLARRAGGVEVSFRDTGIGMSEEEVKDLFEEFYRVRNAKTQGISGTGLGLATARRVVGDYNGRITVSSVPDQGSTFVVFLPGAPG